MTDDTTPSAMMGHYASHPTNERKRLDIANVAQAIGAREADQNPIKKEADSVPPCAHTRAYAERPGLLARVAELEQCVDLGVQINNAHVEDIARLESRIEALRNTLHLIAHQGWGSNAMASGALDALAADEKVVEKQCHDHHG